VASSDPLLEVLDPGLLSTVQDAGRPNWTHLGVPESGACDVWSLAVANLLVGAEPGAAALEMTLVGPTLTVLRSGTVGLAGADLGGRVLETGQVLEPGRAHRLRTGTTVQFPGSPDGARGCRAYLALPGGIEVPAVLGSAATCLVAGFGGVDGRSLRDGDRIAPRQDPSSPDELADRLWPASLNETDLFGESVSIRILDGPHVGLIGASALDELLESEWTVSPVSDRVGIRLDGPRLAMTADRRSGAELLSHGVTWGAVQLPPDGSPVVLLADHQTTGGYPVMAIVITADRPRLGQLAPGSAVHFVRTDMATARAELRRQRAALEVGRTALRDAALWASLWRDVGG